MIDKVDEIDEIDSMVKNLIIQHSPPCGSHVSCVSCVSWLKTSSFSIQHSVARYAALPLLQQSALLPRFS